VSCTEVWTSGLLDTGNFPWQKVFAFTLKGTSTHKMGPVSAHTAAALYGNGQLGKSALTSTKPVSKRTYSLNVSVRLFHAAKPILFFLTASKTGRRTGMTTAQHAPFTLSLSAAFARNPDR
jgi:hypothetical protein